MDEKKEYGGMSKLREWWIEGVEGEGRKRD